LLILYKVNMCICVNVKKQFMPVQLKLAHLTFTLRLFNYLLVYEVSIVFRITLPGNLVRHLGVTNVYTPSHILASLFDGCLS